MIGRDWREFYGMDDLEDTATKPRRIYNPDKIAEEGLLQELGEGYSIYKPHVPYSHTKKNLRFDDFAK